MTTRTSKLPRIVLEPTGNEATPVHLNIPESATRADLSIPEVLALFKDDQMPSSVDETSKRSSESVEERLIERWERHNWDLALDVEMFRSSSTTEGPATSISPEIPAENTRRSSPKSRPLVETLLKRRSLRKYRLESAPAVDFEQIIRGSRISAAGMPDIRTRSGLSINSLRLRRLVVVYSVDGYESGVYQDQESDGSIQLLRTIPENDLRTAVRAVQCGMPPALTANWAVFWLVDLEKLLEQPSGTCSALTDLYFLLGIWCQEYLLHAENLRYGSVVSPAVNDKEMGEFVGVNGPFEVVAHTATTGRRPLSRHRSPVASAAGT
ncbi:MAG: hypothetical protein OXI96_08535 [Acidimicrobiaceae bacterium]|nr:hypothetical protein [Acidimicrobiaceae bacterium]